jgi:membrane protease YdiL (CAAX protease family)
MIALFVLIVLSLYVYCRLGFRIAQLGGKVRPEQLGIADLFLGSVFISWFGALVVMAFGRQMSRVLHTRDVIQSASIEVLIVCLICFLLRLRKVDLVELFGLRRVAFAKIPGLAILLLLAAYPLIFAAAYATEQFAGAGKEPQEMVRFFVDSTSKGDVRAAAVTVIMGAFIAPICEEFLFRGYIYGIIKRYLGITAGVVANAAMFAAVHMNKGALLPLFVLAVCFTLVYETTGSLLVSMTMHSLFNLASFFLLAAAARYGLS